MTQQSRMAAVRTAVHRIHDRTAVRTGAGRVVLAVAVLVSLVGTASDARAQEATGRIIGRVVNEKTAEPIGGAQVFVPGTQHGTLTGVEGRYVLLRVPAGTHSVRVQTLGFAAKTVTGVEVAAGETAMLNIALVPEAVAIEEITVAAQVERGSTTALLGERRDAPVVVDAVGAEQISLSPDGDAAAALTRVPGVSVVDDKYVYVRGLGERYGNTTLNGAPLSSPEPDKKVVPLDIIPSSFLESVVTAKTYSPDQPGDYAGGLVQIQTRDFPSFRTIKFGVSTGFNTETSMKTGLGYQGGSYDFLGFDDGTRDLPRIVPRDRRVSGGSMASADLDRIGKALSSSWGPTSEQLPPPQGFSVALGDEFYVDDDRPLGFIGALTYSNDYSHRDSLVERVFSRSGSEAPEVDYLGTSTTHSVKLGGLFNVSFEPTPANRLRLETIYTRTVDDEARVLEGFNLDSDTNQRNTRIRYLAQSLLSTQLNATHRVGGVDVEWRSGYSRATRYEPNTREVLYRQGPDGRYLFDTFIQSGSVFHSDMVEHGYTGGLDVDVPLGFGTLGIGGSADVRDRTAYTRRFRFLPRAPIDDSIRALAPDALFSPEHIGRDGFQVEEGTFPEDSYDAGQHIYAGYAMLDAGVLPGLRLVGGARVEKAEQTADPYSLFDTGLEPPQGARLATRDVLPALNLTYALGEAMNVRAGVSRTLARPQFRELAPFSFADYAGGYLTVGNPALNRTRIQNYDLRWEWFPRLGSLVAVSAFYKQFDDPIEVLVFPSSELIKSWVNADGATNYGAELEVRTSLGFVSPALENLSVNANVTVVRSEIALGDTARIFIPHTGPLDLAVVDESRPLQGQSPYVVNLGLRYADPDRGTRASLLFNRFGRRIDAVGGQVLPDIYEEARNQLDLVVEQPLGAGFDLKLSAKRLLGNEVRFTQDGATVRRYDRGRTFSLSLGWSGGER